MKKRDGPNKSGAGVLGGNRPEYLRKQAIILFKHYLKQQKRELYEVRIQNSSRLIMGLLSRVK